MELPCLIQTVLAQTVLAQIVLAQTVLAQTLPTAQSDSPGQMREVWTYTIMAVSRTAFFFLGVRRNWLIWQYLCPGPPLHWLLTIWAKT